MGGQRFTEEGLFQKTQHFAHEFSLGKGVDAAGELLCAFELHEALKIIAHSPYAVIFLEEMLASTPKAASVVESAVAGYSKKAGQHTFAENAISYTPGSNPAVDSILAHALSYTEHPAAIYQILATAAYIGMETASYTPIVRFAEAFDAPALHEILNERAGDETLYAIAGMAACIAEHTGSKKALEDAVNFAGQFKDEEQAAYVCEGMSAVAYVCGDNVPISRAINAAGLYEPGTVMAFMDALFQASEEPDLAGTSKAQEILSLIDVSEKNYENPQYAKDFFSSYAIDTERKKASLRSIEDLFQSP